MSTVHGISKSLVWLSLSLSIIGTADAESLSLGKALARKSIQSSVKLMAGGESFTVNVHFVNVTRDTVFLQVESGRIFDLLDDRYQDLITVNTTELILPPHAKRHLTLKAFCKNKRRMGPTKDCAIRIGDMAEGPLLCVCQYLDGKTFKTNTFQRAVWVASDSLDITGVYTRGDDVTELLKLRQYLAGLFNKKVSSLMIEYRQSGPQPWMEMPVYMMLDDEYEVLKDGMVRIVFTDSKGAVVRELMKPTMRPNDRYKLQVRMYLEGLPAGTYHVKVLRDKFLQKEWQVDL